MQHRDGGRALGFAYAPRFNFSTAWTCFTLITFFTESSPREPSVPGINESTEWDLIRDLDLMGVHGAALSVKTRLCDS